ncbi:hypothetical protein [Streptomyces sp. EN23]|uniref:hypothetical protein n=1 Tax=Streptomyces sp. EN23 TaxID=212774 RepID=UPI000851FC18
MGDLGDFRHGSLTEVPGGRLKNPMMTNSTAIDFARSKPTLMVRVGCGGAQDGASRPTAAAAGPASRQIRVPAGGGWR